MIKIGIVDDHAVFRAGLKEFFCSEPDFLVVGEASNGREAIDLVRATKIDVLLMDLSMPGQSGIDSLTMIRARAPQMGVLILTGLPESHYAVNLIRRGASGYLNKDCDPAEISKAIRVISAGRRYFSPAVAELIAQKLEGRSGLPVHQQLTEREFQVFLKLAKGQKTGDIAEELHLSIKTVSTYRGRVMAKMNLGSNSEMTYYAIKGNLLE